MTDILRIKRRATGAPGAPVSLANAEIAYNEVDHVLYYGEGTGGGGGAASTVVGIGGQGLASTTNPVANGTASPGVATLWSRGDHVHPTDTTRAPLASPTFTGTVTISGSITGAGMTSWAASPPAIGGTAAAAGSFTTLSATGALSGIGFTNYLASPPAIGGTAANTGAFTNLSASGTVSGTGFTNLRLDQFSAPTSDVSWNNRKITSLADPVGTQDAANKRYVDANSAGLSAKGSVQAATTGANITLSGLQTIDGYTTIANDRVLVKDQTTQANNGLYVAAAGAWTRTTDMDAWTEVPQAYVFVVNGTVNSSSSWVCNSIAGGTLGTTAIVWVQFSQQAQVTAGGGLTRTGNQFDVVGTAARISVLADRIDIDSTYVGQNTITTLGAVTTGTWSASTILVTRGGTGATTFTAGYLKGSGTSAFTTVSSIPNADIAGLGGMALQAAGAVAITGGTIDGVTFDMGTF